MTRTEYLQRIKPLVGACQSHRDYYRQMVTQNIKDAVLLCLGMHRLLQQGTENLSGIPLGTWDALAMHCRPEIEQLLELQGDHWSLNAGVDVVKEAARVIIEELTS